jgi:hypothetical protein
MRISISSLVFLAVASLAQAQIGLGGLRPPAPSCEQFSQTYHQKYFLDVVRAGLKAAMLGEAISDTEPGIQNLGDAASIAVLKAVDTKDLATPKMVRAYLEVVRAAFSQTQMMVACADDKTANVTIFLLDYLREKVKEQDLQGQIDSTKQYVLRQAPLRNGHGN